MSNYQNYGKFDDEEEYGSHQTRSPKKKEKKRDDFDTFGGHTTNKKCKNCIHKNECDQTNAAKCKRFAKGGRKGYDDDYDY